MSEKLNGLNRTELLKVARFADKNPNYDIMSNDSIMSYLRGKFPDRSLNDFIRALRKQGVIAKDEAVSNLVAAGVKANDDFKQNTQLQEILNKSLEKVKADIENSADPIKTSDIREIHNSSWSAFKDFETGNWVITDNKYVKKLSITQQAMIVLQEENPGASTEELLQIAIAESNFQPTPPTIVIDDEPKKESLTTKDLEQMYMKYIEQKDQYSVYLTPPGLTPSSYKPGQQPAEYVTHEQLKDFGAYQKTQIAKLEHAIKGNNSKLETDLLEEKFRLLRLEMDNLEANVKLNTPEGVVQQVNIVLGDLPPIKLKSKHVHGVFEKGLRLLRAGLNVMLVGPAGSGKTTVAEQWAEALGVPYYFQSVTAGTSESALTAKLMPLGPGGAMRAVAMPFPIAFAGLRNVIKDGDVHIEDAPEMAGLYLADEIDGMDNNTSLTLNAPLANGKMTIEALLTCRENCVLLKSKYHYMVGSANTFGNGTDLQYAGRGTLDGAFLDRWYVVTMGYDPVLEAQLGGLMIPQIKAWKPAMTCSDADLRKLVQWVLRAREKIENAGLRKIWGTRNIIKAQAARRAGIPSEEVKRDLMAGWPHDLQARLLNEED